MANMPTVPGQGLVVINVRGVIQDTNKSRDECINFVPNMALGKVYNHFSKCDITMRLYFRLVRRSASGG